MTFDVATDVIQSAFRENEASCEEIEIDFMGGEPLLEFDLIKKVSEWMWNKNWPKPYVIFATTNGTLLNEEMKEWFTINKHRIILGISFDGDTTTQNINRSNSASLIDIDYFVHTWPLQPVKMTLSRETLPYLLKGVQVLHNIGFKEIHANLAYGINWKKSDLKIYKSELADLVDFYYNNPNIHPCSLLNIDITEILYRKSGAKYCGVGTGLNYFDTDGKKYPCHWFTPLVLDDEELNNALQIDFQKESYFLHEKCKQCRLSNVCSTCYGMNFKVFGCVQERSSWYCAAFIEQFLANCRLQAKLLKKIGEPFSLKEKMIIYTINKVNKSLIHKNLNYATI